MYDEVAASVDRLTTRAAEAEKERAVATTGESLLRKERDGIAGRGLQSSTF